MIAALSIGYPVRNVEAELLAQLIEYEVSYFVDNRLLATSIDSLSDAGRRDLTEHIRDALFTNQNTEEDTTVELDFEDQRWLVYILPIVQPNQNGTDVTGYYTILA